MTTDEIRTLGRLARISLTDNEVESFNQEIDAILNYVSVVKDIAADEGDITDLGVRFNVLRTDVVTNVPGQYTERILAEMPKKNGQFLAVKKILKQE